MEILKQIDQLKEQVFEYFGYQEDWRVLPLDDSTDCFWSIEGESVVFGDAHHSKPEIVDSEWVGTYYQNEIYRQVHLSKHVYRGKDYTMICVDTKSDNNQFLQVFSNDKEIKIKETV